MSEREEAKKVSSPHNDVLLMRARRLLPKKIQYQIQATRAGPGSSSQNKRNQIVWAPDVAAVVCVSVCTWPLPLVKRRVRGKKGIGADSKKKVWHFPHRKDGCWWRWSGRWLLASCFAAVFFCGLRVVRLSFGLVWSTTARFASLSGLAALCDLFFNTRTHTEKPEWENMLN